MRVLEARTREEAVAEVREERLQVVVEGARLGSMREAVEEVERLREQAALEQGMLGEEAPFRTACEKSGVGWAASCR